jgi:hypothetical protein
MVPMFRKVFMVMQQQFPVLTHLTLEWDHYQRPLALPSGFLGKSALCLQYIHLENIPFPELPILLLSTSDIIHLYLSDIVSISSEAMIACLATLPRLEFLHIEFKSSRRHPDRVLLPPITRILLPVLSSFEFCGISEYLEDLISRIDSPRLNQIHIEYSCQPSEFQVANLFQFIDCLEDLKLALIRHACINVSTYRVSLVLDPCSGNRSDRGRVNISAHYLCIGGLNSYHAKLFGQPSTLLSRVVHLELYQLRVTIDRRVDDWLHILRRFSATRTLLVSVDSAGDNTPTLEDVTRETVAEILPVLDLICIDDQPVSCIEMFLAARRLSGRPVTVIESKAEFFDRAETYVI